MRAFIKDVFTSENIIIVLGAAMFVGFVVATTLFLFSGNKEYYFEGKILKEVQIEDILEDRLEDENGIDFTVTISESTK